MEQKALCIYTFGKKGEKKEKETSLNYTLKE